MRVKRLRSVCKGCTIDHDGLLTLLIAAEFDARNEPLFVGNIQRRLGIHAAQMSRIIRKLENASPPLIECQICPSDKRKILVTRTDAGIDACENVKEEAVSALIDSLCLLARQAPAVFRGETLNRLDELDAELQLQFGSKFERNKKGKKADSPKTLPA